MKIRAVDIAQKLNISKATVSLALNNKPGVSQETKDAIFRCKEELEHQLNLALDSSISPQTSQTDSTCEITRKIIKIVIIDRKLNIVCDSELNVWTEILRIFDQEAKNNGYTIGITYVTQNIEDVQRTVNECNASDVAGVIFYAPEMSESGFELLKTINKPVVFFDYDFGAQYHSVLIDNEDAVQQSVEYLVSRGCKKIQYLAQAIHIYNFARRQIGFMEGIQKENLNSQDCTIIPVGTTIDSIEQYMLDWLMKNPLPDAFLMENYQISIGTLKAFRKRNIKVPEQVSLIGIDKLPAYMTGDLNLTCVQINHQDRASACMKLLLQEIESPSNTKFKLSCRSQFLIGDSVR